MANYFIFDKVTADEHELEVCDINDLVLGIDIQSTQRERERKTEAEECVCVCVCGHHDLLSRFYREKDNLVEYKMSAHFEIFVQSLKP